MTSTLRKADAPSDPLELFQLWYDAVQATARDQAAGPDEPTAASLATCSKHGKPSIRVVLLKSFDRRGFVFYTNYQSRKGLDLENNPHAALCFFWFAFHRQLRVEGSVERVAAQESDSYFASRDRGSQVGAWASEQSMVLASRATLEQRIAEVEERFPPGSPVPRPAHWGGYRLVPESIEFWQGRQSRLHDRLRYTRAAEVGGGWRIERLSP